MTPTQTDEVDLREFDAGDEIRAVLADGEEFTLYVADTDGDPATDYSRGHRSLTVEGEDVWQQVQDRVESEVLNLRQQFERVSGDPRTAKLFGTVWKRDDDAPKEAAEPYYESLGEVETVERRGDA